MHLAWDVMVGLGTLLFLLVGLVRPLVAVPARHAEDASGSCASRRAPGSLAVIAMEAGWVVTEVGRQPWIVRNYMKVEDAATANEGVWITFLVVVAHLHRRRRHARFWCCAA